MPVIHAHAPGQLTLHGGLATLAPLADQVVALQVKRFKTFVETGRPE